MSPTSYQAAPPRNIILTVRLGWVKFATSRRLVSNHVSADTARAGKPLGRKREESVGETCFKGRLAFALESYARRFTAMLRNCGTAETRTFRKRPEKNPGRKLS